MILSHKYKYIFIKTNKTAGTSVEIALSKYAGKTDILTPLIAKDELMRQQLGYPSAQNFQAPFYKYNLSDIQKLIFHRIVKKSFYNHMPAREIKSLLKPSIWDNYLKFCVVRHPMDRIISLYYWLNKQEPRPSLSEFVQSNEIFRLVKKGTDLYTINGQVVVDEFCRYEQLNDDLERIRLRLGLPEPLKLPFAKSEFRPDKRTDPSLFSGKDKERIATVFKGEIERFDYKID
jgi:hypothetical protein